MVKLIFLLLLGTLASDSLAEDLSFFCVEEESAITRVESSDLYPKLINTSAENEVFVIEVGDNLVVQRRGKKAPPFNILKRIDDIVFASREDRHRTLYYSLQLINPFEDTYAYGFIKTVVHSGRTWVSAGACTKS